MTTRFTDEDIAFFCKELSLLLPTPGISTGDALELLAEEEKGEGILTNMANEVKDGATLTKALQNSGAFPDYLCQLVRVSEETGHTEEALNTLSEYYLNQVRLRRRVRSALLYPAVMLALMLVVIGVLLVKVLPVFDDVYASLGGRLTGVAGGLLALGHGLENSMPILWGILILLGIFALAFTLVPSFHDKLTAWWQEKYGDKGIARQLNTSRLAYALSMAIASGDYSLEQALELSADLIKGGASSRCRDCAQRLNNLGENETMGDALRQSQLFPPRQCRVLELGYKSGVEEEAIAEIARDLTEEGEAALDAAVGKVEPALVLVCSLLVGLILLSVMLPLMNIMAAIG